MAITDDKKKAEANASATVGTGNAVAGKSLDFGDLKPVWGKMLSDKRPNAESNLLKITTRLTRLDPMAEAALAAVKKVFSTNESALRKLINRRGIATELDRVVKRLNATRISENKRVILAAVYPSLLNSLLACEDNDKDVEDDVGFAEAVLFELERENGPLDRFAQEVVKLVGARHRINFTEDNVLCDLIAYQVRAGL